MASFPQVKITNLWVVRLIKPLGFSMKLSVQLFVKVNSAHQIDISCQSEHEENITPSFCQRKCL